MISLFLASCLAKVRPVILIPGTYASVLRGTGHDLGLQWYCPQNLDDEFVWVHERFFIPPVLNCMLQWIRVYYNQTTNQAQSYPGIDFQVHDFGGIDGITHLDKFVGNISLIPYYSKLVTCFQEKGYVTGETLFGAPYDWRFGMAGQHTLYPKLKDLVETAYAKNEGEKVCLIGHSLGGFIAHEFLTKQTTQEWRDKYIAKAVYVAPSFGGAGEAVKFAWLREFQYSILHLSGEYIGNMIESAGAVHIHFPNFMLFDEEPVIYGPDDSVYYAKDLPQLFYDHGKIAGDNINLFKLNQPYLSKIPEPPNVRTYIMYNSGIPTENGYRIKDKWDGELEPVVGRGDTTLNYIPIRRWCDMNNNNPFLECNDINNSDTSTSHFGMIKHVKTIDVIFAHANN